MFDNMNDLFNSYFEYLNYRYCQKIQDNDQDDGEYSMENKPSFELNGKGCNCELKSKDKCRVRIDDRK